MDSLPDQSVGIMAILFWRRVAGWRAKILPIVEEQDARDPFDIHVYGDCILTRLTQLRVTGAAAPLAICAAADLPAVGGKSTAMALDQRHSAVEQLPAPPVELSRALADEEQWRISRCAKAPSHIHAYNSGCVLASHSSCPSTCLEMISYQQLSVHEAQHVAADARHVPMYRLMLRCNKWGRYKKLCRCVRRAGSSPRCCS